MALQTQMTHADSQWVPLHQFEAVILALQLLYRESESARMGRSSWHLKEILEKVGEIAKFHSIQFGDDHPTPSKSMFQREVRSRLSLYASKRGRFKAFRRDPERYGYWNLTEVGRAYNGKKPDETRQLR